VLAAQIYIYSRGDHAMNWILTLFWLPTSCVLIYTFALRSGVLSKNLSKSKFLAWIGDISGEAFL
jgi:peptidoglycan/LPS O-acetylase OafA/YrhL